MRTILALLLFTASAFCQDYLVKFCPDNKPYAGMTNWPAAVHNLNTVPTPDYDVRTNLVWLASVQAPQWSIYNAGFSNDQVLAATKANANLAKIVSLFNQIPSARGTIQNVATNANAGNAVAGLKQVAGIMDGVLEMFQRLLPELRDQYDGSRDQTP